MPTESSLDWVGAPSEVQNRGPAFHARVHLIATAFRRLRPNRLLDIGCGRGYVTAVAARYAKEVVAVDVEPAAVAATRDILTWHPNSRVVVADILRCTPTTQPSELRGLFDAVLLSEVLEHLEDDVGMLRACRQVLTERGVLVLTVPANPNLWTRWDDLAGHKRRYRRAELVEKLNLAGFRVDSLTNWGFPLTGWLAIKSARIRARRIEKFGRKNEVPEGITKLLPVATLVFRAAARIEPLFSFLDRGAGYVVVATRNDAAQGA